jgi:hypothetical protein
MCKKVPLNFYETSIFVGLLLDLIHLSRKLEFARQKMVDIKPNYTLPDAYNFLLSKSGKLNQGYMS